MQLRGIPMQFNRDKYTERELKEAKKFDRVVTDVYKNNKDLIVEPIHWEKFDTDIPIYHHPYPYVVRSLGELTGKKILEIGCGTGNFSIILAKRGAKLVESFDISVKSIELAMKRAKVNNVADLINFQAMSVYEMNYKENFFDFIVGFNILHHINIEKVVDKIYWHLKPGGTAYFLEPFGNILWLERLRLIIPVKLKEEDKFHYQEQLTYKDVEKFKTRIKNVECLEFHLFSRLDRLTKYRNLLNIFGKIDEWILVNFPIFRKYSRKIVIKLKK
jgi:2-polyprenyl-3-methyl-5-hydroxy-6-metoxy-1,4-benzoquinol methylase